MIVVRGARPVPENSLGDGGKDAAGAKLDFCPLRSHKKLGNPGNFETGMILAHPWFTWVFRKPVRQN